MTSNFSRVRGYLGRRFSGNRRLSLREAVGRGWGSGKRSFWLTGYTADRSRAALLSDMTVTTARDAHNNAHHAVFTHENTPVELQGNRHTEVHKELLAREQEKIVDEGIWIAEDWQGNYYHWLVRHLPKLILIENSIEIGPLVLPARCGMQSLIDESLDALGWCAGRRLYVESKRLRLLRGGVVQLAAFDSELLPALARRLSLRPVRGNAAAVFVSRENAGKRRIVNEQDLAEHLRLLGIKVMVAEKLSFQQQRQAMSAAKLIVGAHGAGLTNMLFMPSGGTVIEIRHRESKGQAQFERLAAVLGHKYIRFPAGFTDPAEGGNSDIEIDRPELVRRIEAVLSIPHGNFIRDSNSSIDTSIERH